MQVFQGGPLTQSCGKGKVALGEEKETKVTMAPEWVRSACPPLWGWKLTRRFLPLENHSV